MEAEAKYTYVGIALIALIAALVTGVVWLNRTGSRGDFNHYTIYFERQQLDGLQMGADVDMRGIKIGRVEDYDLLAEKINRVRVTIRTDRRAPVRTNTVAIVIRNFVTGIARISLITPEPAGPPLVEVTGDQQYPVIAEGESSFDAIAGKVGRIGDIAVETLENINLLLTPDNRAQITASIVNLRELTAGLNQRVKDLDTSLAAFNGAATQVGRASATIAQVAEKTGNDIAPAIKQADQTLKDVSAAAFALEKQTSALARTFSDAASTTDEQLTVAVGELRSTVEAMTRLLDQLRDPRAALLGPGKAQRGPGE
ncbi:MAG: MCE family protein [Burkholderiaceae bacterium]|nr:MCE family protein [Burkholderiaceae bacterium]